MKFLIQSQVFIALIAVAYSVETELLLNQKPEVHLYLFLVFLSTFLIYNICQTTAKSMQRPLTRFMVMLLTATFILVALAFWARWQVIVMLIPLAILSLLYTFPIVPFNSQLVPLRAIPYIKIFLITLVWSLVTVLLPVVRMQHAMDVHVWLIFIERMIFVFVLALMFDIRDMEQDQRSGLKTIPLWLGEGKSKKLCRGLLILFLFVTTVHYSKSMLVVLPAMTISAGVVGVLLNNKILAHKPVYYFALVDSMMLVQAAFVFFSFWLSGNWI
ncbi:MAG: UbiA family prenyltransferase [Cyclobacteriaceae bacterium]|nr:UbiA family prenyltransferase [Cyclobacteriaceae bacterium]